MLEVLPLSPKEEWASLAEKILADAPFPDVIDEVLFVLQYHKKYRPLRAHESTFLQL